METQAKQADFSDLQELWFEDDMKSVLDKVGSDFPHHYSAIHSSVGNLRAQEKGNIWSFRSRFAAPCSRWSLFSLGMCIQSRCASSDNTPKCVLENCEGRVFSLSQDCRSCAAIASNSALDIMSKCANANTYNRVNRPGLLILSRQPLTDVQYVDFHDGKPVIAERGYIKAMTDGGMNYVCTHLTTDFGIYFETKLTEFTSFQEQQKNEIGKLINTFSGTPHVLLGDLNTGPARNPDLTGEMEENYNLLKNQYKNAYLENNGSCTFCGSENPVLIAEGAWKSHVDIDHVLTSPGVTADVNSSQRVLDDVSLMLSDHFGVQQDICLP
ncbi:hypothetical protein ACOMHN_025827 [Nucella lapillus]